MGYFLSDFKRDVEEIINICQEDLDEIAKGNVRQATTEQIEKVILPEMHALMKMIEDGSLPPQKKQVVIIGCLYNSRMELEFVEQR
jgi:5,10-methylene-tetrahydrofolate dehydrogenase/methenyl tetrahydrofolate cyclohydrolase